MIVGVDEAGRGPLAGPVVSCALYLKGGFRLSAGLEIKDSKELAQRQREKMFSWLNKNSVFSVGIADNKEIDELNILQATFLSFNRAIKGLFKKAPYLEKATFIIDGPHFRTDLSLRYICMKKADKRVKQVSCASIVAKVVRDHLMNVTHAIYPQWNFFQHKGYPTRGHIDRIKEYSVCPIHRRTFFNCREYSCEYE